MGPRVRRVHVGTSGRASGSAEAVAAVPLVAQAVRRGPRGFRLERRHRRGARSPSSRVKWLRRTAAGAGAAAAGSSGGNSGALGASVSGGSRQGSDDKTLKKNESGSGGNPDASGGSGSGSDTEAGVTDTTGDPDPAKQPRGVKKDPRRPSLRRVTHGPRRSLAHERVVAPRGRPHHAR